MALDPDACVLCKPKLWPCAVDPLCAVAACCAAGLVLTSGSGSGRIGMSELPLPVDLIPLAVLPWAEAVTAGLLVLGDLKDCV